MIQRGSALARELQKNSVALDGVDDEMNRSLVQDQKGMTTVEYALLGAVIALVAIGGYRALGESVSARADEAATRLAEGAAVTSPPSGGGGPGAMGTMSANNMLYDNPVEGNSAAASGR